MSTSEIARPGKAKAIAVWILCGLLAFMFVLAGVMKFASPEIAKQFVGWGYADWFRALIGVIEVVGGVALLGRRTAFFAAVMLAVVMVGAIYTLLAHDQVPEALSPTVFLLLLGVVAYARRP